MNFKRLSVVVLLLGLAGYNYPSKVQANEACHVWMERVDKATYTRKYTRSKIDQAYAIVTIENPYLESAKAFESMRNDIKKGMSIPNQTRWCRFEKTQISI